MTPQEEIQKLSLTDIARLIRFAPAGHKYFDSTKPYYRILMKRFHELGGWTPALSKSIGWEKHNGDK